MEQLMRKKGDGSVQTLVDSTFLPDLEEELEALDDSSQVSITYWESRCMPLVVGVGGGGLFVGVPHPFTHLVPPQTHMRPRIRTHTHTYTRMETRMYTRRSSTDCKWTWKSWLVWLPRTEKRYRREVAPSKHLPAVGRGPC